MNRIILLFLFLAVSVGKTLAQCAEVNEPKVLLVGDSWAWFMNTDGTINSVLKTWGFSNYKAISNSTLAVNGAQTDDFQKPAEQAEILNQLTLNPSIEVVHLSIGGNDFLGDWNKNMTQGQTDTLTSAVFERLDSIIRFIKTCKPGIKVLWSGYCYTNFEEVITTFIAPTSHPFYSTWHSMQDPSFAQINNLQNSISAQVQAYCDTTPNVHFIDASGLMQYVYGQNPALAVPPGVSYPPFSVPLPHGDPTLPSPKVSMRDYGITKDCYHLSADGYKQMFSYQTQKFYHKLLMDDMYLLSDTDQTGSVSSTGNTTHIPYVGETGGEQFATILSFNTTGMADTTLKRASIFLRRKALTGTNPVSANSFVVKMKNGNFGASASIEATDFTAADDANGTGCNFGSFGANGDWVRIDLPVSLLTHINHNSITQFMITAPNASGGRVEYYDAMNPDFAPVLNLAYGETPSAINEASNALAFNIYPNPTTGKLTIERGAEVITHIEVTNLLGEIVLQPQIQHDAIDISSLATGMYMLNITTKNGKASQRVYKD